VLGHLAGALGGLSARMRGGGAGSSIADAYTYLPSSVKRFPGPRALAGEMERAGLTQIHYLITAGGIVAIHAGTVPAQGA
jgi:demethylmenaquinone methyltransferase/2-methoxy-6-polyprenyl-1,4-benzoquinol methylase